jgi:tRNA threonylcarbamoyladenosine biosynthesis protein TsaE
MAKELRERLKPGTFIGLRGQMGAGKTTLISEVFKDQGVAVASPTFALYNAYDAFGVTIVHVDLYRLDTVEEIDSSGFWDLFADKSSVVLTEWVERISVDEIPLDWKRFFINIEVRDANQRLYSLFS